MDNEIKMIPIPEESREIITEIFNKIKDSVINYDDKHIVSGLSMAMSFYLIKFASENVADPISFTEIFFNHIEADVKAFLNKRIKENLN